MPRFFVETHVAGTEFAAVHIVSAKSPREAVEPGRRAGIITVGSEVMGGCRPTRKQQDYLLAHVQKVVVKTFPLGSTVHQELAQAS